MKLYAENELVRSRQILLDAAVAAWIYIWIRIGMFVHDLVASLAHAGRLVEDAGSRFASSVEGVGEDVGGVPLLGDALQRPFSFVAEGGRTLQQAGADQQEIVLTLALWLGVLLAVIPIGYALLKWLPGRIAWMREATAASKIRMHERGAYVLALRAAVNRPLHQLRRAEEDPGGALLEGRFERLAALELAELGLEAKTQDAGTAAT